MAIRELGEMTWEEMRDLEAARTVAILPVGAMEAHGPHLPLATDVLIAEAMARAAAERLERDGFEVVILPPLAFTAAPFATGFAGTLSAPPAVVTETVTALGRELARHDVAAFAIANAHLDPAHIESLAAAVMALADEPIAVACPDVTRRRHAERLGEEFMSGACHAGRYEGSIVMAVRPELVRDDLRTRLPANPASLVAAIRAGKRSFAEAGGPSAYFGDPAAATADEGHATIETLGAILAEAVSEALAPEGQA